MKELELLLENYWISKDEDKELYYKIKDHIHEFKSFITEKLGYQIIINPYLIKLEKLPGKAEEWMGISTFHSPIEYAFLCLLLMFLEDKGKDEQFVLSEITDFIQGNFEGDEKVDWTLYRHRRSLIKVMRFATDIGMIKVDDGDEQSFAQDATSEVLYESTGLSRYFVRNFTTNILNYKSYKDLENEEQLDLDRDRGIIRRHRVYRRLIMSPIVYNEGTDDPDYDYIKKQKSSLENDLEKYLGWELHVHRNGAMAVLSQNQNYKDVFPENKSISDIVLQLNKVIKSMISANQLKPDKNDTCQVSLPYFQSLIQKLKLQNSVGWSKEYREMQIDKLTDEIINYMSGFNMIEILPDKKEIKILPLCGKIVGVYPDDFYTDIQKEVAMDESE
ncbi:hypothetical protein ABG79_00752 [Caloramator mitchellensis]|uniref:TIGR02678 family protein n=1 Tax=Caloramator mitchellensis TaxID=908809 RepID=A0A0R3JV16_CALMK|nr:TIGR02678 family protein [Caloramator mitchellensis]KRQ87414.1 hypothetical protein ABG79_00752 [Caloramator mitchellensis]